MKIKEVEDIKKLLADIKSISDGLDYNTSTAINQKLIKITPVLNSELNRLEAQGVDVTGPKILIFTNKEVKQNKMSIQDYMNKQLNNLVLADYKVIDYGKLDEYYEDDNTRIVNFYIKYTI